VSAPDCTQLVAATAAANVTLVGSAGSLKPDRPVLWRRPAAIETQATKAKINVERASRPHQRDIGKLVSLSWKVSGVGALDAQGGGV
jgi:hypothetical protein